MIKQFEGHVMSEKELLGSTHKKNTDYCYYFDESCHLMSSDSQYMVLGALACPKNKTKTISKDIKNIKEKHSFSPMFEIKSTKVSMGKYEFYEELLLYFLSNDDIHFRAIIIDKSFLNHNAYDQTHDEFYYKIAYYVFDKFVYGISNYIYIDHKDSYSHRNGQILQEYLSNHFEGKIQFRVQQIDSKESNLLQLSDLIIGLVTYKARNIKSNDAKLKLIDCLEKGVGHSLSVTTYLSEDKINILKWRPNS